MNTILSNVDSFHARLVTLTAEENRGPNLAISEKLNQFIHPDHPYVMIGDRVYRVYYDPQLGSKNIGMKFFQIEDFFASQATSALAALPSLLFQCRLYPPKGQQALKIKSLHLEIYPPNPKEPIYLSTGDVSAIFKTRYLEQYLCQEQKIAFPWHSKQLTGSVLKLKTTTQTAAEGKFALLDAASKVKIKTSELVKNIHLLDEPATFENPIVECQVTLDETDEPPENITPPYGISAKELYVSLQSKIKHEFIYPSKHTLNNTPYPFALIIDIVHFTNPRTGRIFQHPDPIFKVTPCLTWRPDIQFNFTMKSDKLVLVQEQVEDVAKLSLSIIAVTPHKLAENSAHNGRLPCFFIDDIRQALQKEQFFRSACRYIQLWDSCNMQYNVKVEIESGVNKEGIFLPLIETAEPQWSLLPKAELQVQGHQFALLATNRTAQVAQEIVLHICPAALTGKHRVVAEKEICDLLRKKVTQTVAGEKFIIMDTQFQDYNVQVEKISWRTPPSKGQNQKNILTQIAEHTQLTLRPTDKLAVSKEENAHSDDIREIFKRFGIGALTEETIKVLKSLKRHLVTHRDQVKRLGLTPPRGIILYGPPGTGKSKMAMAIMQFLGIATENCQSITVAELQNKYVGETEENIRHIIEPAQKACDEEGENSPLFGCILDEIDGLFRPCDPSNKSWENTPPQQLMGIMDGTGSRPMPSNLIFIGITNHIEAIEPALLRPGRFGTQVELKEPTVQGRCDIFLVHTAIGRANHAIADNIDWMALAQKCKDFTGAMIKKVIDAALEDWMDRPADKKTAQVTQKDFAKAIEEELKAQKTGISSAAADMFR